MLSDVTSPLTGPDSAAAVFGPQKGASRADIAVLDSGLTRLASVALEGGQFGAQTPGAGAAGGVGYGLTLWGAIISAGGFTSG